VSLLRPRRDLICDTLGISTRVIGKKYLKTTGCRNTSESVAQEHIVRRLVRRHSWGPGGRHRSHSRPGSNEPQHATYPACVIRIVNLTPHSPPLAAATENHTVDAGTNQMLPESRSSAHRLLSAKSVLIRDFVESVRVALPAESRKGPRAVAPMWNGRLFRIVGHFHILTRRPGVPSPERSVETARSRPHTLRSQWQRNLDKDSHCRRFSEANRRRYPLSSGPRECRITCLRTSFILASD